METLQEVLSSVEHRGIGERREEGYGQIAFNHPIHESPNEWEFDSLDLGKLSLSREKTRFTIPDEFIRSWQRHLDNHFDSSLFKHESFGAAARLIYVTLAMKSNLAIIHLKQLGDQSEVLNISLNGREKQRPLSKRPETKQGVEEIETLLNKLGEIINNYVTDKKEAAALWRIGMTMLADRLAKSVRNEINSREDNQ